MRRPREVVAGGERGIGAGDMGAGEVHRVLGRLEQRDRAAEAVERRERLCLLERQPPERPEQANLGVAHRPGPSAPADSSDDDGTGPLELAEIGEGVAEVGAVADPRAARSPARLRESSSSAALEQLDGFAGSCPTPHRRGRASSRRPAEPAR